MVRKQWHYQIFYQYYNLHFHIIAWYNITASVLSMNITTMIHKMVIHIFVRALTYVMAHIANTMT